MNRRAMIKLNVAFFAPVLTLLLSACDPGGSEALAGTDLTGTPIGGTFALVDKDAMPVTWDRFQGKYRVVYFGYTFCPDVCPVDVAVLMRGYDQFAKAHPDLADKVQPIFITVDPARDTPKAVGEFAAAFSPKLIGLTGTPENVAGAIKAFRVYAAKGEQSAGGYMMDHSRHAYLMDPQGKPIEVLPTDQGAEAVARDLGIAVK